MKGDKWLKENFERELKSLRSFFPSGEEPEELEQIEEDGAMSWEEAMSEPLLYDVALDVGGEMEIKINQDETLLFTGGRVSY